MTSESPSPIRLILGEHGTPIGQVLVIVDEAGAVRGLDFLDLAPRLSRLMARAYPIAARVSGEVPSGIRAALDAYFEGRLDALSGMPHRARGTDFQARVWEALTGIPPGATLTYGELAQQIGSPGASRAVGLANASNPVGLIIPCHRVIGRSGALTGYAGGLDRKAWLLAHEGVSGPYLSRHSSAVISQ